ncbi:mitochondria-eating protein-like isoform X2 [Clavelina lepadiformis]|uniref:mitochondria-eating protein-like isoform X2 n=1 Tax=Clavelina lepadiformis TaxID=159417 RepID=UPI0040416F1B
MSETIRRLANGSSFIALQDKINFLKETYPTNSCDSNLGRLCELTEITSKIQSQLFTAMSLTASEGGTYGGVDTLKSRLLPWLGAGFMTSGAGVTSDTSLALIQESVEKDRKISDLKSQHNEEMLKLETELSTTQGELDATRDELNSSQAELEKTKVESGGTMLASEEEIILLRSDLRLARDEVARYKAQLDLVGDYERQIDRLRDEISLLRSEKDILESRLIDRPLPLPPSSPTHAELTNSIRHSRLVARFNDLYAVNRLDMQDRLRRFVDDDEMIKRIIFIAVCESFHVAKMAYRSFRLRARKLLSPIHSGPGSLEEAVTDYIVRNLDLYDVDRSVEDVIRAMNVNPKISFPPECEFILLSPFIREVCKVAYSMQALDPTLDIPLATDGELMSESKYRRSYDSEFTAPLVAFHVWPALMEDHSVLIKGECVTRRGALSSPRRSRSPSPLRSSSRLSRSSLSPRRSRSPSPRSRRY